MLSSVYNPKKQGTRNLLQQQEAILFMLCYFLYGTLCILDNPKTSFCVRHLKDMNKIKTYTLSTDVYGN